MADGLIPGGMTIVYYVSPDGVVIHLSGGTLAGAEGMVLGDGPDGLGHAEAAAIFDEGARMVGEEYVATTFKKGSIDLPIHVFGDTVEQFHRRRDWLRELICRDRQGWLCVFTTLGWRSIAVRRGAIKPSLRRDPAGATGTTLFVLFYADNPLARAADGDAPEWVHPGGIVANGHLALYPGREVNGWPKFTFTGPGTLHIVYDGVDGPVELWFPQLNAGEVLRIDTEHGMQKLEAVGPGGRRRNLWPLVKGPMDTQPIPAGVVTTVRFSVMAGSTASRLWGTVPRFQEGLL
ncbi:phage tail family protein [Prescottella equi]